MVLENSHLTSQGLHAMFKCNFWDMASNAISAAMWMGGQEVQFSRRELCIWYVWYASMGGWVGGWCMSMRMYIFHFSDWNYIPGRETGIQWRMSKALITCSYIHCTNILSQLSERSQYLHGLLCVHVPWHLSCLHITLHQWVGWLGVYESGWVGGVWVCAECGWAFQASFWTFLESYNYMD